MSDPHTEADSNTPESAGVSAEVGQDLTAEAAIATRLRSDRAVQGLYDVLAQNPDIRAEVAEVQSRRDELGTTGTRTYSAEFIGLCLSARGSELLDLTIERSVAERSDEIKAVLREGEAHVHEIVVGSGVHACIYNSERAQLMPESMGLTVERSERIGGQFAQTEEAGWRLNTRTRPEDPSLPNLPGTPGSLNSLENAPVQQADLTSDAYATQKTLAEAIRVSHLLVSEIVSSCELVGVSKPSGDSEPPVYRVELRDTKTGETYVVTSDRIMMTTGLGETVTGLEHADSETQAIVAEERAKTWAGEHAQVMTVDEYMRMVGNDAESFPLRGQRRIAVVGGGDSGATVVEYATGHGPGTRKSTSQIDRVESIFWIGQKAITREEFLKQSRERYTEMSLEFPRAGAPDYPHRITAVPDRCIGLRRVADGIEVIYGDRDGNETGRVVVDHIVLATGIKDKVDTILSGISEEPLEREPFHCAQDPDGPVARRIKGENIFLAGPAAALELTERDKSRSPALSRMGITKTPAVWSYVDETALLARELAAADAEAGVPTTSVIAEREPIPVIELPPLGADQPEDAPTLEIPLASATEILPTGTNSSDILQLTIAQKFVNYRWPEGVDGINLSIDQVGDAFVITSPEPWLQSDIYRDIITDLMQDEVVQEVCAKLTNQKHNRSRRIDIRIPVISRKVRVGGMSVTPGASSKT